MRACLFGVAAIGVTVVLALSALPADSGTKRHASLRVTRTTPLTVAGSSFKSRERVRVTATVAGSASTRAVRASRRGALSATFSTAADRCSSVRIVAVGNAGSRAIIKRLPGPACILQ